MSSLGHRERMAASPRLCASAALRKISRVSPKGRTASPGRSSAYLLFALCVLLGACERAAPPEEWTSPIAFDTGFVTVRDSARSARLLVEVARTESQRAFGLMQRPALPDSSGMVFLYEQEQGPDSGFWMFQTRVPLDIAFFDTAGVILKVLPMEPCPSPYPDVCRNYPPGVAYVGALEVNRGWFARHGLGAGARIDLTALAR